MKNEMRYLRMQGCLDDLLSVLMTVTSLEAPALDLAPLFDLAFVI